MDSAQQPAAPITPAPAAAPVAAAPTALQLRYEFGVVPGPLIEEERRWRRGAISRFGTATARVWSTQDERWVRIKAVGGQEDRNELLTMIRLTLRKLFAEYKDLQAVEQWEHNGNGVPRATLEEMGLLASQNDEPAYGLKEVE
jgi:hypothetical protein